MKKALLVLACAVAGCATNGKFIAKMDRFIGQPEAAVVGTYGAPQSSYQLNDGSRVLTYVRGGTAVIPGATTYQPVTTNTSGNLTLNQGYRQTTGVYNQTSTSYVPQQGAPIAMNLWCRVNFTIDSRGVVQTYVWEGNNCVAD